MHTTKSRHEGDIQATGTAIQTSCSHDAHKFDESKLKTRIARDSHDAPRLDEERAEEEHEARAEQEGEGGARRGVHLLLRQRNTQARQRGKCATKMKLVEAKGGSTGRELTTRAPRQTHQKHQAGTRKSEGVVAKLAL